MLLVKRTVSLKSLLLMTVQPIRPSAILEAAAARDSRIRCLRGTHAGAPAARNLAISQARGSLIAPLDADDLWHPEKIAQQVEVMRASSPKVGVVYCWTVDIDENDVIIPPIREKCTVQGNVVAELVARNNFLEIRKRASYSAFIPGRHWRL